MYPKRRLFTPSSSALVRLLTKFLYQKQTPRTTSANVGADKFDAPVVLSFTHTQSGWKPTPVILLRRSSLRIHNTVLKYSPPLRNSCDSGSGRFCVHSALNPDGCGVGEWALTEVGGNS
jgi:hypothetical protein